jgi:opacity protein-like surface antigen
MRRIAGRSFASALSFAVLTAASASAQESLASRTELSLMGGIQTLNQNDTGLPDNIVNVPAVGTLGYRLSRNWAIEGEFSWLIPVQQQVEGAASTQDMKTPDILAYQANLRADLPQASWSPYLAAGLGAVTFLSNTNADVVPQLAESQTAFAINFGGGVAYPLAGRWGLRADFRELVAFPASDAVGLSSGGNADPIWMERGTLGLAYRF